MPTETQTTKQKQVRIPEPSVPTPIAGGHSTNMTETAPGGVVITYEEMIRVARANGEVPEDTHSEEVLGSCNDDSAYAGKTLEDLAGMPQPLNSVCPHPKVIVPYVQPLVVKEIAKEVTVTPEARDFRVADFDPRDGRSQGFKAMVHGEAISEAHTEIKHGTTVVDTPFDYPEKVKTVSVELVTDGKAKQPLATDGSAAAPQCLAECNE